MAQFRVLPYFAREKDCAAGETTQLASSGPGNATEACLDAEEPEDGAPEEVVDLSMDNNRAGAWR